MSAYVVLASGQQYGIDEIVGPFDNVEEMDEWAQANHQHLVEWEVDLRFASGGYPRVMRVCEESATSPAEWLNAFTEEEEV